MRTANSGSCPLSEKGTVDFRGLRATHRREALSAPSPVRFTGEGRVRVIVLLRQCFCVIWAVQKPSPYPLPWNKGRGCKSSIASLHGPESGFSTVPKSGKGDRSAFSGTRCTGGPLRAVENERPDFCHHSLTRRPLMCACRRHLWAPGIKILRRSAGKIALRTKVPHPRSASLHATSPVRERSLTRALVQ